MNFTEKNNKNGEKKATRRRETPRKEDDIETRKKEEIIKNIRKETNTGIEFIEKG